MIEEHGHFIHDVFEGSPQVRPLITSPDGEIYGLPQVNECYHCFYSQRAWINSDWLAERRHGPAADDRGIRSMC